jgi:hypothetical protein
VYNFCSGKSYIFVFLNPKIHRMKNLIYLLICLLGANDALAQIQILAKADKTLFPFYENGKVGYFYFTKNKKPYICKCL